MTTVTLANLSAHKPVEVVISGIAVKAVSGRILQGKMDQFNDFDNSPLSVQPFDGCAIDGDSVIVKLPACCVAAVELR